MNIAITGPVGFGAAAAAPAFQTPPPPGVPGSLCPQKTK